MEIIERLHNCVNSWSLVLISQSVGVVILVMCLQFNVNCVCVRQMMFVSHSLVPRVTCLMAEEFPMIVKG